jgi:hypothetical protein
VADTETIKKGKLSKKERVRAWGIKWMSNITGVWRIFWHVVWTYIPLLAIVLGYTLIAAACIYCGLTFAERFPDIDVWTRDFKGVVISALLLGALAGGKAMKSIHDWPVRKKMLQAAINAQVATHLRTE